MQTFIEQVSFYNQRFAFSEERFLSEFVSPELKVSLVIPCYNEEIERFIKDLNDLGCQKIDSIEILLVLNHSSDELDEIKEIHQTQFSKFSDYRLASGIKLNLIPAFDLKPKHAGVGLARKIGMDEALKRFQEIDYPGLIVCLDADCKVAPNYFDSLLKAESEGWNGLSLYYEHPFEDLEKQHLKSIINYEIFLRYYSLALKSSGYPHYFQTVGSSMACRANIYSKIGGMNRRKAGEDFYFLHKVFPHSNFKEWTETTVYPSARKSNRVPFGTGKAMIAEEQGLKDYSQLFNPQIFKNLGEFLSKLRLYFFDPIPFESHLLIQFFKAEKILNELKSLKGRSTSDQAFCANFYFWLDGFKVMKYLHYAQQNHFPDLNNIEACAQLLNTNSNEVNNLLLELRAMEKGG